MRFANDQQRTSIVGATGSGKTFAAVWQLSLKNYDQKPWIIYDFKYDEMINSITGIVHIAVDAPVPDRPGLYVVHPHPAEADLVEAQMWKIWERGNIGVFVDEGYMVGKNNQAFRALLTQGRSKHIPMIVLSQRPVWMDRFVFSESEFFQIFRLQHKKDVASVQEFIPFDLSKRLPEYHSYYYDVHADKMVVLGPVPKRTEIMKTFNLKMEKLNKKVV